VYLHPTHNLALVGYDPALIGATPVEAVRLEEQLPEPGAGLWVVGLRGGEKLAAQAVTARSVEPTAFPLSRTMRFRDTNLETLQLQPGPTDLDGVVVNRRGAVVALWSSFAWQGNGSLKQENRGLPATYVAELLRLHATGEPLRSLEAEFTQISLAAARRLGLPGERADELAAHDPGRRQVLSVARVAAGTPASALLQSGDVLLRIDGRPVTRFRELELAVQKPQVTVEVFRDGAVRALDVATVALSGDGVRRVVFWGGAVIQSPYRDMAIQRGVPPDGVYVAFFAFGSPASRYGLFAGRRITAVDGQPVSDLDGFIDLVRGKRDRESVRLTSVTWNNQPEVLTLKVDDTYWPGYQIRWQDGEWRRGPL
jgi:S1-C subfamily serine protease